MWDKVLPPFSKGIFDIIKYLWDWKIWCSLLEFKVAVVPWLLSAVLSVESNFLPRWCNISASPLFLQVICSTFNQLSLVEDFQIKRISGQRSQWPNMNLEKKRNWLVEAFNRSVVIVGYCQVFCWGFSLTLLQDNLTNPLQHTSGDANPISEPIVCLLMTN